MGLLVMGALSCRGQEVARYSIDSATLVNLDTKDYKDIAYAGTASFFRKDNKSWLKISGPEKGVTLEITKILAKGKPLQDLGVYDVLQAHSPEEQANYGIILSYESGGHLIGISLVQGTKMLVLYVVLPSAGK